MLSRTRRAKIVSQELKRLFPGELKTPLHYRTPWQLLVAVILSAQCTDERVNEVTKKLFRKYKSIHAFALIKQSELEQDIYSTGFYRNKAQSIIGAMRVLEHRFHSTLPKTIPEMLVIPGVGRKTASVVLGHIYGVVDGIAVDTHVRRLARKFGLSEEYDPGKIERDLMVLIPKKEWWDVACRLKAYGRIYSPARQGDDDPISICLQRGKKKPQRASAVGATEKRSNKDTRLH